MFGFLNKFNTTDDDGSDDINESKVISNWLLLDINNI